MKVLNAIIDFIFGKKYYVIIITRVGVDGYMTHSDIFTSKQAARQKFEDIRMTTLFHPQWIESFRSHEDFVWHSEKMEIKK